MEGNTVVLYDINLTGSIAAQLVENLKTPWYATYLPYIVGSLITALLAIVLFYLGQRNDKKMEERKFLREERKKAYIHFISQAIRAYEGPTISKDVQDKLTDCIAELRIVGRLDIIYQCNEAITKIGNTEQFIKSIEYINQLMRDDLLPEEDAQLGKSRLLEDLANPGNHNVPWNKMK